MPYHGHLNPMIALARAMKSRGHEIIVIGVPDCGPFARAAGLEFVPYCEKEFPEGSIVRAHADICKQHGLVVIDRTLKEVGRDLFRAAVEHLPRALAETGVEAVVIDTIHMFLELVPMSLGMPYAQAWVIVNVDFSGATPPCVVSNDYEDTPEAREKNLEAVKASGEIFGIVGELAQQYADRIGLKVDLREPGATASKLAIVSQMPVEFDFPNIPWPPQFHYAGPFVDDAGREPAPFPWEKLDGRPLVFASLGTLVNGKESIYKTILPAVARFPELQVVLSKGVNIQLSQLGPIPTNVIVVDRAPQVQLLKRATLCITHAGFNTTLETLSQGVPMVAIPISYDQPGSAARIKRHGVGEFIEVDELSVDRLYALIQKVLNNPAYREKAQHFKKLIAERRGLDVAAEAIESAFEKSLASQSLELTPA